MSVTQQPSLSSLATDPLRNFKFQVIFRPTRGKAIVMGVMNVSGVGINIDVIPYREGGMNITTQNMPGQASFSPITMSKGLILGSDQLHDVNWIKQLFTVMQGSGNQGPSDDFRMTVDVYVVSSPVTTVTAPVKAAFRLRRAWPSAVAWGDLDAGANQVLVRQVSLVHEGFDDSFASSAADNSDAPAFTS